MRTISLGSLAGQVAVGLLLSFLFFAPAFMHAQTVDAFLPVGTSPVAVAVNPITGTSYVANRDSNSVSVIAGSQSTTVQVGTSPVALALNPLTNQVYIANQGDDTVTVLDGNSGLTTTLKVGIAPQAIAINPVTNRIYVANSGEKTVTVIDGATNTKSLVNVGAFPDAVAVNPVTNFIYAANFADNTVTIINGVNLQTTTVTVQAFPAAIAVNPVTNQIYVANNVGDSCSIIDGASQQVTNVPASYRPSAVAVNPVTNQVYVANSGTNMLTVIDGATQQATNVAVGLYPSAVAVNASTNQIYLANRGDNTVSVVDGHSLQVTTVLAGAGPAAIAVNPLSNKVYVASSAGHTVMLLDGATDQTTPINVGGTPQAVAVNPASHKVYALNSGSGSVSIYDPIANQTSLLTVGSTPSAIAINPGAGQIFVANSGDNTLSVINEQTSQVTSTPVGAAPAAVALNVATNLVYVANTTGSNLSVVNAATLATTNIQLPANPGVVAVNPATNQIYASLPGKNAVAVIDGPTQSISTVSVGANPSAIAVNPVSNMIYVANAGDGTVTVIDGLSNQTSTVQVGGTPTLLAVDPVLNHVFVGSAGSNTATLINGVTLNPSTIALPAAPVAMALNLASNHLYLASAGGLFVVDGITTALTTLQAGSSGTGLDVDPSLGRAYLANGVASTLTAVAELNLQNIPLTTAATPLLQNQSIPHSVSFTLNAAAGFQPTAPSVLGVYYQIDSWQDAWQPAAVNGSSYSANTSGLTSGTHVLYAFAADAQLANGTGLDQSLTGSVSSYVFNVIEGQSSTALNSSANPSVTGQQVAFTATVTPVSPAQGTPTGTVSFYDGATLLSKQSLDSNGTATFTTSALSVANHNVQAIYAGDANVLGSSSALVSQAVNQGGTAAALAATPNPSPFGQNITLNASISPVSPAAGVPTGTVSFYDGTTLLASGVALAGGQASITTSLLGVGSHALTVAYSGDGNFLASASNALSEVIGKDGATAAITSSNNPSVSGQSTTLTASVQALAPAKGTPTGTVSFLDGATVLVANAPLNSAGQATTTIAFPLVATHAITVAYNGDGHFAPVTSAGLNQIVNKGATNTKLTAALNPASAGQAVALNVVVQATAPATGIPTGTVTLSDGGTLLTTIPLTNGQANYSTTSLPVGTQSLTATYSGDGSFAVSDSSVVSEIVNPAALTVSATRPTVNIQMGNNGSDGLQVSSKGVLSAQVTFSCTGLPAGSQCMFNPSTLQPAALPATVSITITTAGATLGSVHPASQPFGGSPWYGFALVLPGLALLAPGKNRRHLGKALWLVLGLAALALVLALSACGGSGSPTTTSYSVTVTATSGSTQSSAPITVMITH